MYLAADIARTFEQIVSEELGLAGDEWGFVYGDGQPRIRGLTCTRQSCPGCRRTRSPAAPNPLLPAATQPNEPHLWAGCARFLRHPPALLFTIEETIREPNHTAH